MAAFAAIAVSCSKEPSKEKGKDNGQDPDEVQAAIVVDGNIDDWGKLQGAFMATNNPESMWPAVNELRVYAEGDQVFYYIRFNREEIADFFEEKSAFPARVNINTDGEFASGYQSYFLQGYDFMIETSLGNGEGGWGDATGGTLYQRIDGSWVELIGANSGLIIGAGSGAEYELVIDRAIFNKAASGSTVPMPMGNTFQTSMRFYTGDWGELSNIPNGPEGENKGYGNLLEVTFAK